MTPRRSVRQVAIVLVTYLAATGGEGEDQQVDDEDKQDPHSVLCGGCGRDVADPYFLKSSQLSPMNLERGNMSLFGTPGPRVTVELLRNPSGVQFRVVTFARTGCQGLGDWTGLASWYPGYHWKVCVCSHCGTHLGWMFEPEDTADTSRLKPSEAGFYALILDKLIDENFASSLTMSSHLSRKIEGAPRNPTE